MRINCFYNKSETQIGSIVKISSRSKAFLVWMWKASDTGWRSYNCSSVIGTFLGNETTITEYTRNLKYEQKPFFFLINNEIVYSFEPNLKETETGEFNFELVPCE